MNYKRTLCFLLALGAVSLIWAAAAEASSLSDARLRSQPIVASHNSSGRPVSLPSSSSSSGSDTGNIQGLGEKDLNQYSKDSLAGKCDTRIHGYCVVYSDSGCGNFYIGQYHYGGSKSCAILGKNCPVTPTGRGTTNRTTPPAFSSSGSGGGSGSGGATTTSSTGGTATLKKDCTPGVDCPADDLGAIIAKFMLSPSTAGSSSNTCPLFWVPGTQTADATVTCVIKSGSETVALPSDQSSYPSGYPVPVGIHTLECTRTYASTGQQTVEDQNINCHANPVETEI